MTASGPASRRKRGREGILLNAALANDLGVKPGDTVALQVQKASGVPRETLLGRRDEQSVLARLQFPVAAVLADDAPYGRFNLNPSPAAPRNAFVPLALLQDRLDLKGRVNALLSQRLAYAGPVAELQDRAEGIPHARRLGPRPAHAAGSGGRPVPQARQEPRRQAPAERMARPGCGQLRQRGGGQQTCHHAQGGQQVLSRPSRVPESGKPATDPGAGRRRGGAGGGQETDLRAAPTLVYLANTIAANGDEIPYSIVAALDPAEKPPLGPFLPPGVESLEGRRDHPRRLEGIAAQGEARRQGDLEVLRAGRGRTAPREGGDVSPRRAGAAAGRRPTTPT